MSLLLSLDYTQLLACWCVRAARWSIVCIMMRNHPQLQEIADIDGRKTPVFNMILLCDR